MIVAFPVDSVALFFKTLTNKPFANKWHGIYAINRGVYHSLTYLLTYISCVHMTKICVYANFAYMQILHT